MKAHASHAFQAIVIIATLSMAACHESLTGPSSLHDPEGEQGPGGEVFFNEIGWGGESLRHRQEFGETPLRTGESSGWTGASVVSFATEQEVEGWSALRRSQSRVQIRMEAGDLVPGSISTLWAVVFNNPIACVDECDDPDLFDNPATRPDLMYVAGGVANRTGKARFAGQITVGDLSDSILGLFGANGYGVEDGHTAEIHLVVRSHGPGLAGLRQAQMSTFNGGCTGYGPELGTPGPNTCEDLYYSSHYAVN